MSKIFDVEKMYGQDFSIVATNAPSNVIKNSEINLLPSILLVSSPEEENKEIDNNYPSLFITDYNSNPLQLTYPLYFKDGLSLSEKYGYAYVNIDRNTIETIGENGDGPLYVNTDNLAKASINNYGVVKIAEEMGLERDNYKIGNFEIPNDSFINVNDDGIIYLSNNFFDWIGDIISAQVKEKVDNIKIILNNNLRIWLEITNTNINNLGGVYNLNTANSSINISSDNITSLTFDLKYLSFYNDVETIRFNDISEHSIYKIEYNGSTINNQDILTTVDQYNDDLFLHSIYNITLTFLPNYYIDEYNLNNNEEYNLSIEFVNNSSHPTEKVSFKQNKLFNTSDTSLFNITFINNKLPLNNINSGIPFTLTEQVINNIFNKITDNDQQVITYKLNTYVKDDESIFYLINNEEYDLDSGKYIIEYDSSINNNKIDVKSFTHNIIEKYLEDGNGDRFTINPEYNVIDTEDNSINVVCEFVISINNTNYILTKMNKLYLILFKSISYGFIIISPNSVKDKFTEISDDSITYNSGDNYYANIYQYIITNNYTNVMKSDILVNADSNTLLNYIAQDGYSLTQMYGIINDDIGFTEDAIIKNLQINYIFNIIDKYYYQNNSENVENYENNYELNKIGDDNNSELTTFNNNFNISTTNDNFSIETDANKNMFTLTLNRNNSIIKYENIISTLFNGLDLDINYQNTGFINSVMNVRLDILDIILKNMKYVDNTDNQNIEKGFYEYKIGNSILSEFNNYIIAKLPRKMKSITITIPDYILYLLISHPYTGEDNTQINKFGILFDYIYGTGDPKHYQIEIYTLFNENKYSIIIQGVDLSNNTVFKIVQENNSKTFTIQTQNNDYNLPSIKSMIFVLKSTTPKSEDDVDNTDFIFNKSIKLTSGSGINGAEDDEYNTSSVKLQWEGFITNVQVQQNNN